MQPSNEKIEVNISAVPEWTEIKLSLNNGVAQYGGIILAEAPDRISAYTLTVEPAYRGQGMGEVLVRKLANVAKELGANTLIGHIESQYALDIRARIFGKEALRFYDDSEEEEDSVSLSALHAELPITFDQARQSFVRSEAYESDLEFRQIGFNVEVDLVDDLS